MDLNRLISGITQSGLASGLAGGVAGGALTSALMSKKGRKHAGTALQVGGLAAIGGLAWKAYQTYRDGQPAPTGHAVESAAPGAPRVAGPAPVAHTQRWQRLSDDGFAIDETDATEESRGLVLIRAMIAAANADGHIDAEERRRIFAEVEGMELSGSEKALLFDELARPAGIGRVVEGAKDEALAIEVYAASALAVDGACTQGRMYLEALAARLDLPAPLVQEIHALQSAHDQAA